MNKPELKSFVKFRDKALELLKHAGAFRALELMNCTNGWADTEVFNQWLDLLVDFGDVDVIPRESWGQYKIYASSKVHNC